MMQRSTLDTKDPFSFLTARNIRFGNGTLKDIGSILKDLNVSRILVVKDGRPNGAKSLISVLHKYNVSFTVISQKSEPDTVGIAAGVNVAIKEKCDCIVSIGGGSVIDTGKAISVLVTNGGSPLDYMEVIGLGKKFTKPGLPFIAIPTTSGTGAECSKNAVVASKEFGVKVSLRSHFMLPTIALVDPLLTTSVPPHITATTGIDALCHCLESYVTHLANPISDAFARKGIMLAAKSLHRAWENGDDVQARSDMSLVSLFGGISLANAKLGSVHGLAGPLGGMFNAPHGAVVAACLVPAMRINLRKIDQIIRHGTGQLEDISRAKSAISRYQHVAVFLTGDDRAQPIDGVEWLEKTCRSMNILGLSHFGVTIKDAKASSKLVAMAQKSSSMKGNPVKLSFAEVGEIVSLSLKNYKHRKANSQNDNTKSMFCPTMTTATARL